MSDAIQEIVPSCEFPRWVEIGSGLLNLLSDGLCSVLIHVLTCGCRGLWSEISVTVAALASALSVLASLEASTATLQETARTWEREVMASELEQVLV